MSPELSQRRGINAVLSLINWWELCSALGTAPEDNKLEYAYSNQGITYMQVDSEDRLFYDLVLNSWPASDAFLQQCRAEGRRVLVNCISGHNRSSCICVCFLLVHENMTLLEAIDYVQMRRGTILSNHGFRLQLVRLALRLNRLGTPSDCSSIFARVSLPRSPDEHGLMNDQVRKIISRKRLNVKYDHKSVDFTSPQKDDMKRLSTPPCFSLSKKSRTISKTINDLASQRTLSMELLACLVHWDKKFTCDYEYTTNPPKVIGSGFSGDVLLCRRKGTNRATCCVKRFNHQTMGEAHKEKMKCEAVIYLQLEHPHIAPLYDLYEDDTEVSLVMQYCPGGTLRNFIDNHGDLEESQFQSLALQMLRALSYIHDVGIVHRDIKPNNFVIESDGQIVKLIDFGFSVKGLLLGEDDPNGLKGCLGTLGYLAPEVVRCGRSSQPEEAYTAKVDVWSLGVVFYELLVGRSAFEREQGTCDGYTKDIVLREIEDVTPEAVESVLENVPAGPRAFVRRMLTVDPSARPSAREALDDPYLKLARESLLKNAKSLPVSEVVSRFSSYGSASRPTRASLLAMARSRHYVQVSAPSIKHALRATFDAFDQKDFSGAVGLEAFLSVVTPTCEPSVARSIWKTVCGEQDSLSYCEFLAALLPPIEDAFEDVIGLSKPPSLGEMRTLPRSGVQWDPSLPISTFFPLLRERAISDMIFSEEMPVMDVVRAMFAAHYRWVLVRYRSGKHGKYAFFDYVDINYQLVLMIRRNSRSCACLSDAMAKVCRMSVGSIANSSGHAPFVPAFTNTPLGDILLRMRDSLSKVPIFDPQGALVRVFSCRDFLDLALHFPGPTALLKTRSARTFDFRDTMFKASVPHEAMFLDALRIMDAEHLTICPISSHELSGDLGGVVAINVISVADLKWIVHTGDFGVLDQSMNDFLIWRSSLRSSMRASDSPHAETLQHQISPSRFNVVSVDAFDSLQTLASRLLASKLERIFLSSDTTSRIVGNVSARDILIEVLDQLLESGTN
eukprot:gnl/TRDRNA2_/TRDRNA2_174094_c0_seq1.p1 gnl/TRDRNA2_/TRDRNA2_174094_c0~~gnl/TRDRNA2_/TRDRNA2_174094_c0_seq1.p1  ORF type:complete len:1105 (+),score=166.55 gnl/TRDRNA2_/TRDRNA2_174094_c0_seq1:277-3315(+)